jgi:Domain of unknown function (DUF4189)
MTKHTTPKSFSFLRVAAAFTAPIVLAFTAHGVGPTVGGNGGAPFELRCPTGAVLVGIDLGHGDNLDRVQPLCRSFFAGKPTHEIRPGQIAGGPGGTPRRIACQGDTWVQRLKVDTLDNRRGYYGVSGVEIHCADGQGQSGNFWYAHSGDRADTSSLLSCDGLPGGKRYIAGLHGRSGALIDQLGPYCVQASVLDSGQDRINAGRDLVYAADGRGRMGFANGWNSKREAEGIAINGCGGPQNGCKVVLNEVGNCMAFSESNTPAGYWFYVSVAGDIGSARNFAQKFCTDGPAPRGTCTVRHAVCN